MLPLGFCILRRGCSLCGSFPLLHKSGNLPYLFRFNTTLVRRVQPICRRAATLVIFFFMPESFLCASINQLYSFDRWVEGVFFYECRGGMISDTR